MSYLAAFKVVSDKSMKIADELSPQVNYSLPLSGLIFTDILKKNIFASLRAIAKQCIFHVFFAIREDLMRRVEGLANEAKSECEKQEHSFRYK